jgi:putative ABC transport system substrate-binding protein
VASEQNCSLAAIALASCPLLMLWTAPPPARTGLRFLASDFVLVTHNCCDEVWYPCASVLFYVAAWEVSMRRRNFIAFIASAGISLPRMAWTQGSPQMRRVGALMAVAENDPVARHWVTALQERLEKLGWQLGRNLRIDYRWTAGSLERMRTSAAELVSLNPDVLLAGNIPTAAALQQATRTLPIVFLLADPVASGFVAGLAHPGGNMTGFIGVEAEIVGKQLELLNEIAPAVRRVAFMSNPADGPYVAHFLQVAEASAPSLGKAIIQISVHNAAEIESVITAWGREASAGLYVAPGTTTLVNRELIAALAAQHRLPAVYSYRFFVTSGGLISYGPDITEEYRQAAQYIDQILKGATAGELPVQAPAKFELVINLKAARAIGLEVSAALLLRADEVIQ